MSPGISLAKTDHTHDELVREYDELLASFEEKQKAFVIEYTKDFNGTQAALRAGYSEGAASHTAWLYKKDANVARAVQLRLKLMSMTSEEAIERMARMGRADLSPFIRQTADGEIVVDLSTKEARDHMYLIRDLDITVLKETHSSCGCEGCTRTVKVLKTKIKLHDAKDALDKILKIHGDLQQTVGDTVNNNQVVIIMPDNQRENPDAIDAQAIEDAEVLIEDDEE